MPKGNAQKTTKKVLKKKRIEFTNIKTFDRDIENLKTERERSQIQKEENAKRLRRKPRTNQGFTPGIVYLGHIPDGFTPKAMKEYFTQFGDVGRIRLACSRKTGRSKGYAFIEFKCDEVAKVVAETMNNYFMFEKLLKCVYIPKDQARPDLFKGHRGSHKLAFRKFVTEHNKTKDLKTQDKALRKRVNKLEQKKKKLQELGIELNFALESNEKVKKILENRKQNPTQNLPKIQETSKDDVESGSSSSDDEDFSFAKMFLDGETTDSSKYTLEMDSTDDEISFNTPPKAKKSFRKRKVENNKTLNTKKNKYESPKTSVNESFSIKPLKKSSSKIIKKKNTSLNLGLKKKGKKLSNKTM